MTEKKVIYSVGQSFLDSVVVYMAKADIKMFETWRSTPLFMGFVLGLQLTLSLWIGHAMPLWASIFLFVSSCVFLVIWLLLGRKSSIFLKYREEWMKAMIEDAHMRAEIDTMIQDIDCIPPSQKEEEDAA